MTDQAAGITEEDLRALKENLLHIRAVADRFRLAGIQDDPSALSGKKEEVSKLWEEIEAWDVYLWSIDPQNTLRIRAYIDSACAAMTGADAMYRRWEKLSARASDNYEDEGHKRLIEKHCANSRRRFTDLSRETREAAHIAYFLLTRLEVAHVKQPA